MGAKKTKEAGTSSGAPKNPEKRKDKSKKAKALQVLVAGAAQSGKSTFFKQLQLIHCDGFSEEQKSEVLKTLRSNIILGFKELVEYHDGVKKPPRIALKESLEFFRKKNPFDVFDEDTQQNATKLWSDKGFQKVWASRDTIPNLSILHLQTLMDSIERLSSDADPTTEDILLARKRTTGTNEIEFNYNGKDFRFVDVGGQKSERRHWDQIIEKPDAVVFFVALTDWNLPTVGNPEVTKLQESLNIFEEIMEYEAFSGTLWIIMLNKMDLFKEKITRVSFRETFEDYSGEDDDAVAATDHIRQKFLSLVPSDRNDSVQSHVACALDTEQMKAIFAAMQTSVLERLMSGFGML